MQAVDRILKRGNPAPGASHSSQPRDLLLCAFYWRIGLVHLLQSQTDEAIIWLEKARNTCVEHPLPHAYLASAYALKSDTKRAALELREARRLSGDNRYSSLVRLRTVGAFQAAKIRSLAEATYFVGLRKAGMPKE